MRLARFGQDRESSVVALVVTDSIDQTDRILPVAARTVRAGLARAEELAAMRTTDGVPVTDQRLWAPVDDVTIAELEGNSTSPAATAPATSADYPRFTLLPDTVVNHPGAFVNVPHWSRRLTLSAQVAFVCGPRAAHPDDAGRDVVAGYTLMLSVADWTLVDALPPEATDRDRSMNEDYGRWFDGYKPLGPWVVTPDEVADPRDLEIELTVGHRDPVVLRGSTMRHTPGDVLRTLARCFSVADGDVVGLGSWGPTTSIDPVAEPLVAVTATAGGLGTLTCTLKRMESPLQTDSPLDRVGA